MTQFSDDHLPWPFGKHWCIFETVLSLILAMALIGAFLQGVLK